jgi:hypothetical protein
VPTLAGVRSERFKYLELETGEKELYDLHADPGELSNLLITDAASVEAVRISHAVRLRFLRPDWVPPGVW